MNYSKFKKRDIPNFLVLGLLVTALQRITYFYAINLTTVMMTVVLFYTYPIFVTIYAVLFLKEKATFPIILAIILTFSGAALVIKVYHALWSDFNLFGVVFGMLPSIFFILYFFIVKELRKLIYKFDYNLLWRHYKRFSVDSNNFLFFL